jgi:hypothetical protein
MTFKTFLLYALALTAAPLTTYAHHSMAIYDTGQQVSIEGTVTRVAWRNPHVYIYLDETLESGEVINWEVEGLGPSSFRRLGWSQDTLQIGDQLVVAGNPTRNISRRGVYPETMHRKGTKLFDGGEFFSLALSAADASGRETNSLNGNWVTQLEFDVIVQYVEGREFSNLTPAGEVAVASFDEETMNAAANCAKTASPFLMIVPDIKKIELQDDLIRITGDYDGAQRRIFMGIQDHAGAAVSSQGHSIGRWEDNTLVIDTANFADDAMGNGWALPSGSQKHLMEYLTLNDDMRSLTYRFELTDPEFMTSPFVGSVQWQYGTNTDFIVDECDLHNAQSFLERK